MQFDYACFFSPPLTQHQKLFSKFLIAEVILVNMCFRISKAQKQDQFFDLNIKQILLCLSFKGIILTCFQCNKNVLERQDDLMRFTPSGHATRIKSCALTFDESKI